MEFEHAELEHFTKYASKFTPEQILNSINYLDQTKQIVSIGSGNAALESFILNNSNFEQVTCIDPEPTSYGGKKKVFIEPKYKYLDDTDIFTNSILFLIAPSPNSSRYDFDSLVKQPWDQVFLIIERTGSAGGKKLLGWLNHILDENKGYLGTDKNKNEINELIKTNYKLKFRHSLDATNFVYELIILEKDFVGESEEIHEDIEPEADSCVVM